MSELEPCGKIDCPCCQWHRRDKERLAERIKGRYFALIKAAHDYRVGIRRDGESITDARNRLQGEMGDALDAIEKEPF